MRRPSTVILGIAILMAMLYVASTHAQAPPQPKSPSKGPPQLLPWPGGHALQFKTCTKECGYPTGLYEVCRDNSGRVVSRTLITLNACMR